MNRSVLILTCLTVVFCGIAGVNAQDQQLMAVYYEWGISNSNSTPSSILKDERFLEGIFAPDTIPQINIPVLTNALGDVNQDDQINILDLLRLRDIIIGRPPAPSAYEITEGDITYDGTINSQDLNVIRDVLLFKKGVPYILDSLGGQVLGDGIMLTIPPGALDSVTAISIRRTSESEFAREMGVDTKGAEEDSAYYMTSFEITSSTAEFSIPIGATIRLDSVPPCAYEGLNGLFAVVPDRDGDGQTELFLINELELDGDSLTVRSADIPVPEIQSLSASSLESGQTLVISGDGFGDDPQSAIVRFIPLAHPESVTVVPPRFINDSTIIVTVPGQVPGQYAVEVYSLQTGIVSNTLPLTIAPNSPVTGDIRAIIVDFFQGMVIPLNSTNLDTLFYSIEDTTVRNFLLQECGNNRSFLANQIDYFSTVDDSLIPEFEPIASFILNRSASYTGLRRFMGSMNASGYNEDSCVERIKAQYQYVEDSLRKLYDIHKMVYTGFAGKCMLEKAAKKCDACEAAEEFRKELLDLTDLIADLWNMQGDRICRECPGAIECDKCKKTVSVGFGPKGQVTGAFDENGNWKTEGVCTNIKKYKRNECIGVLRSVSTSGNSPVPVKKPSYLECPSNPPVYEISSSGLLSADDFPPHAGSIIKITNTTVPYNMVGILNDNGHAFVPHVPFNTKVTFSIYDPVSGLYDPDAGTYTTGSEAGGFDRPMLLFQPNSQIRTYTLKVGEPVHDSVSLDMQRIDYLLQVGAADTLMLFNFGFSANARLSLRIEDPEGIVIFDNADIVCYSIVHLRFNIPGIYRIRVAYGVSGESGSFDFGVSYSPSKPLPANCLCRNTLVDTLYEEISPYEVKCVAIVGNNDTLVSEAGVILEFDEGGAINANGTFMGEGSPLKPILLKYYIEGDKQKSSTAGAKAINGALKGKEVER